MITNALMANSEFSLSHRRVSSSCQQQSVFLQKSKSPLDSPPAFCCPCRSPMTFGADRGFSEDSFWQQIGPLGQNVPNPAQRKPCVTVSTVTVLVCLSGAVAEQSPRHCWGLQSYRFLVRVCVHVCACMYVNTHTSVHTPHQPVEQSCVVPIGRRVTSSYRTRKPPVTSNLTSDSLS